MNPKMRRNLPGTFHARDLGGGTWCLSRGAVLPMDVFLRGAAPSAADVFRASGVGDIDIEWREGSATLTVTSDARRQSITVQSAIVHEPLPQLYEGLPLASFDEKARRFWRGVFRLVRIPGGRALLGFLARRRRGR